MFFLFIYQNSLSQIFECFYFLFFLLLIFFIQYIHYTLAYLFLFMRTEHSFANLEKVFQQISIKFSFVFVFNFFEICLPKYVFLLPLFNFPKLWLFYNIVVCHKRFSSALVLSTFCCTSISFTCQIFFKTFWFSKYYFQYIFLQFLPMFTQKRAIFN